MELEYDRVERVLKFCDVMAFVLILLGLWKIDISVSALLTGGVPTNGFAKFNPIKMYHIGLWATSGGSIWLMLRAIGVTKK